MLSKTNSVYMLEVLLQRYVRTTASAEEAQGASRGRPFPTQSTCRTRVLSGISHARRFSHSCFNVLTVVYPDHQGARRIFPTVLSSTPSARPIACNVIPNRTTSPARSADTRRRTARAHDAIARVHGSAERLWSSDAPLTATETTSESAASRRASFSSSEEKGMLQVPSCTSSPSRR